MRRLRDGETPDALLAGLRQLALLAGGMPDKVLATAFVRGLPEQAQEMLWAGAHTEALTLHEQLTRAQAILTKASPVTLAGTGVWPSLPAAMARYPPPQARVPAGAATRVAGPTILPEIA
ncbi:hypothetical protein M514_05813 [Trichuris suis]|uniref:Uncharacterized protein n=1 Tax=Trichuris suis TaxID=68888 RepID=A0A085NAC9_9BILA|nr:hypothetical protein M513_05813 [Trichuris suis]KFD66425.1 hypothetical protein M514_05813 [Trichuris suis]KHJ42897.1 hypothetical protein D918_06981 [Trichuris suis]